ncbi:hypothetical protein Tco_0436246 [Tanacetum coccineum]
MAAVPQWCGGCGGCVEVGRSRWVAVMVMMAMMKVADEGGAADGEGGGGWCCGWIEMVDVVEWQRGGEMMTMRWRGRRRLVLWWDGDGGRGGVAAGWEDDDDGGVDGGDDVGCGGWMAEIRVTAPENKEREER